MLGSPRWCERRPAMYWNDAKKRALPILRDAYRMEIERIAAELRPRIEARELGGWRGDDTPPGEPYEDRDPMYRLEAEMRARLAPTERDALLVLAASPDAYEEIVAGGDRPDGVALAAGDVAALDVL